MELVEINGKTIVFDNAYTGVEEYGRIDHVYGDTAIIHKIGKEEAGPNPRRVMPKPDARIAEITGGTGIIK